MERTRASSSENAKAANAYQAVSCAAREPLRRDGDFPVVSESSVTLFEHVPHPAYGVDELSWERLVHLHP